jgi:Putative sensor
MPENTATPENTAMPENTATPENTAKVNDTLPETLTGKGPQTVEQYVDELKQELAGQDPALIQDAMYDAEEYLSSELETYHADQPGLPPVRAFAEITDKYGSPAEVAQAYRDADERLPVALPRPTILPEKRGILRRFFGVMVDPRAYLSLFFMFFSLATGIAYFTWLTTGLSLSVGLMVLIVGLPMLGLFVASVRVIALVEGRLVEAMLGERMPRRPILNRKGQGWWAQLKGWLADSSTWTTMLYMGLMLPLGIFYFTLFVTLLSVALSLVAAPFLLWGLDLPVAYWNGAGHTLQDWAVPLLPLGGILLGILTMHLARAIGFVHGRLAKGLLVSA